MDPSHCRADGDARRLFLLGTWLVAYGNVAALALGRLPPAGGLTGVAIGFQLIALAAIWARWVAGVGLRDLGLGRSGAGRSGAIGLLVALAMVLPALIILKNPPILGDPVTYAPVERISPAVLLWRVFVSMPLDTVVPEEIAFRGVLLAALRRRFAAGPAVALAALPFVLWHGVILSRTLGLTNLGADPFRLALGLIGGVAALFIGGVLFGALRVATGHLAGSLAAHWGFNAALLVGLAALPT
jgi:membrane protease YdiL (CAAX protease family)